MKLLDSSVENHIEVIQELIESGESLLFVMSDETRYLVDRESTNNKYATMQNVEDGGTEIFHIYSETKDLFSGAKCYINIKMALCVK